MEAQLRAPKRQRTTEHLDALHGLRRELVRIRELLEERTT
jgi:hypothetical protein